MSKSICALVALLYLTLQISGQDLEPRFLSMVPVNGNFLVASYGYSTGNILIDQSLPMEDLEANIHSAVIGYLRTFSLFGNVAKFDVVAPYSYGKWNAMVNAVDTSTSRQGFGDPLLRFSIFIIGGKSHAPGEFDISKVKKFRMGLQFRARAPLGQYNAEKLINLGLNRWAFKTGIGAAYSIKKVFLEASCNAWFFTENNNFFGGNKLKQHPLLSVQLHGSYVIKPGLWLAASVGGSAFGETSLNGEFYKNGQKNVRYGFAAALPLAKRQGLKFAYTSGITTRYGANFSSVLVAYQFLWF